MVMSGLLMMSAMLVREGTRPFARTFATESVSGDDARNPAIVMRAIEGFDQDRADAVRSHSCGDGHDGGVLRNHFQLAVHIVTDMLTRCGRHTRSFASTHGSLRSCSLGCRWSFSHTGTVRSHRFAFQFIRPGCLAFMRGLTSL